MNANHLVAALLVFVSTNACGAASAPARDASVTTDGALPDVSALRIFVRADGTASTVYTSCRDPARYAKPLLLDGIESLRDELRRVGFHVVDDAREHHDGEAEASVNDVHCDDTGEPVSARFRVTFSSSVSQITAEGSYWPAGNLGWKSAATKVVRGFLRHDRFASWAPVRTDPTVR